MNSCFKHLLRLNLRRTPYGWRKMNITFNTYKGFLFGGGSFDEKVDLRKYLRPINSQTGRNKGKLKAAASLIEHRTDGFDALSIAWKDRAIGIDELEPLATGDDSQQMKRYGEYLRSLGFQSVENSLQSSSLNGKDNEELSSHTTLYGQEVLKDQDAECENNDVPVSSEKDIKEDDFLDQELDVGEVSQKKNQASLRTGKKKRLTPEERKQLRQQAREAKKNARLAKMQEKKNLRSSLELTPGSDGVGPRSKVKHLRYLVDECIKVLANSNGGAKVEETTKISQIDDVTLYVADLKNLLDDEWLSDSNIGWVYAFLYHGYILPLLSEALKNSKFHQYKAGKEQFVSPICLLLPTFTFLIANSPDPEELLRCNVLPSCISDAQIIFCPLNDNDDFGCSEGGSHWSLVVFLKLQSSDNTGKKSYIQKALVYDSMFEANASETERLVCNMAKILHDSKDPKSNLEWDIVHVRDSPQQTNGSDCGVYVASVSSFLVSQLIALTQTAISSTRNSYIELSLKDLRFSALDSRIWMLSTLLNFLKNPDVD